MGADSGVSLPATTGSGWRRLWVLVTVCWCLFILVNFCMYLYKSSAALDGPFSWGTWSSFNQAIQEANDPRCVEILRKGPSAIDWDDGGARKAICGKLRYRLSDIEGYPVTAVQANDALTWSRNIDAFLIDPIVGALILFFPPAMLYLFGWTVAWIRRGFSESK